MIRHSLREGWQLLRERAAISFALAVALAVPLALAGLTFAVTGWIGPLLRVPEERMAVAVLLRPQLEPEAVSQWLADQHEKHPDWVLSIIPPDQLAERLQRWFPYLSGLLQRDAVTLLPPLVEVGAPDPTEVAKLDRDPRVLAVGPRSSLNLLLQRASTRTLLLLGVLCAVLLASAMLLAAIWVHLELYRHGDEITIMRLVGATEAAIRGPFLLAVAAPGLLAGFAAGAASLAAAAALSRVITPLGLPALEVGPWLLGGEMLAALLLPLLAAWLTLARHASFELED